MIFEIYNNISLVLTSGLLLGCALMLLFSDIPDRPLLSNYRKARYMMVVAYLFFVMLNIVQYLYSDSSEFDVRQTQMITLAIAVSQATLFTLSLITLLETKFPDKWVIFRVITLAAMLIIAVVAAFAICADRLFVVAFFVLATLYALLLLYYTRLFIVAYRRFREKMDNYFSDFEAKRIRWVALSFFAALTIGVIALLFAIYPSMLTAIIFAVIFDVFYVWFSIRLNNYALRFSVIENALDMEQQETLPEDGKKTEFTGFDTKLNEWVAAKKFTKNDFSIETLALELCTNRNYLSAYFKNVKGIGFSKWINELRIEEAKKLMLQYPNMTLKNIAEQIGFADNSHFIRNFTKLTDESPTAWKKKSVTH